MEKAVLDRLKLVSNTVRQDVIRMAGIARCGNLASSLSIVDILTVLYWREMKIFPEAPNSPERDRFILSKGHGCPALYSALAHRGFFSREELWNYSRLGTMLQGHPQFKITPGIDATTGSIGMGPGIANGMALSLRGGDPSPYVYCLTGDGEIQTGSFWESMLFSSHHGLDKVILIIDLNHMQSEGSTDRILSIEPLSEKFRSFGWEVFNADGHDLSSLEDAFHSARDQIGRPSAVLARTIPGKGVSFIEKAAEVANRMVLSREEMDQALKELSQDQLSAGGII